MNSGSTISKTKRGYYQVPTNDAKPPIPIAIKLRSIVLALDPRLWTVLPERGQTYASMGIARKRRNFERALREYPSFYKASRSSGKTLFTLIGERERANLVVQTVGIFHLYNIYLVRTSSNCACVRITRFFLYENFMKYFSTLLSDDACSYVDPTRSLCVEERGGRDRAVYP